MVSVIRTQPRGGALTARVLRLAVVALALGCLMRSLSRVVSHGCDGGHRPALHRPGGIVDRFLAGLVSRTLVRPSHGEEKLGRFVEGAGSTRAVAAIAMLDIAVGAVSTSHILRSE